MPQNAVMGWRFWNHYEQEAYERWRALPWHQRYRWCGLAVFAFIVAIAAAIGISSAVADVVVLHDGTGNEPSTILIHSTIKQGDFETFEEAADRIAKITKWKTSDLRVPWIIVDLDTAGGDVIEAIRIGRIVRQRFMITRVLPSRHCASACVFILFAGSSRAATVGSRIGLHRPRFDASYFANLSAQDARSKYNLLIEQVRTYFLEMGGTPDVFQIMLSTRSDQMRYLTEVEKDKFGFRGADVSWEEFTEAKWKEMYGADRWGAIKACLYKLDNFNECVKQGYKLYPAN